MKTLSMILLIFSLIIISITPAFGEHEDDLKTTAILSFNSADYTKAIPQLIEVLKNNDKDLFVKTLLGLSYRETKQLGLSESIFLEIITTNPEYTNGYYCLKSVYSKLSNKNKSTDNLKNIKDLSTYYTVLGFSNTFYGNYSEAQNMFKEALKFNSNQNSALSGLGLLCSKQGHSEKAIEYYKKALEINNKDEETWIVYGNELFKDKNYSSAIEKYIMAYNINPYNVVPIYNIGLCYRKLGEYQLALSYFQKVISLGKDNDDVQYNINIINSELHKK